MHIIHVMGVASLNLPATIGAIRNIPQLCELEFDQGTSSSDTEENRQFTGSLLSAPPGAYCLWEGRPGSPLLITDTCIVMGSQRLHVKEVPEEVFSASINEQARVAFKELLKKSARHVDVYQDMVSGHQKYRFSWPDEQAGEVYDKDNTSYVYLGQADLKTGEIVR